MGGTELKYIQQAFADNWITSLGPNVVGFESDLESFFGPQNYVAALSSGTAAIHLALILAGVTIGDEVLCQSLTFTASANPITYLGAKPIFIDSEEKTWNLCPLILEGAIVDRISLGKKPKAIIAVCIYGMPYQVEEISNIAKKYNIPLIDDSAQALGSRYCNEKCGTFADYSIISFNGNKIITTSGGGALIFKNEDVKKKAIFLSTQAKDDAPYFQHSEIGYNYRLSNISAGIGRGQMEVLEQRIAQKRKIHEFYKKIVLQDSALSIFTEPTQDYFCNYWLSILTINPKYTTIERDEVVEYLVNNGIEARPVVKPLHLQPIYKDCVYYGTNVAKEIFENSICLPSGTNLTKADLTRIANLLKNIMTNN